MAEDRADALFNDGAEAQTPRRGRPSRAETERKERRRRGGVDVNTSALAVPQSVQDDLAAKGLEGRWINDIGNRMYLKTQHDDYDKVEGMDPVPVGVDKMTNKPVMAHFCAKPKAFLEEDNRRRIDRIKAQEDATFSGRDNGELNEGAYNPINEKSSIRRSTG